MSELGPLFAKITSEKIPENTPTVFSQRYQISKERGNYSFKTYKKYECLYKSFRFNCCGKIALFLYLLNFVDIGFY